MVFYVRTLSYFLKKWCWNHLNGKTPKWASFLVLGWFNDGLTISFTYLRLEVMLKPLRSDVERCTYIKNGIKPHIRSWIIMVGSEWDLTNGTVGFLGIRPTKDQNQWPRVNPSIKETNNFLLDGPWHLGMVSSILEQVQLLQQQKRQDQSFLNMICIQDEKVISFKNFLGIWNS